MKIRTQFLVLLFIFILLFITISISIFYTSQQVFRVGEQEEIAGNVVQGAYELSYLSNDYLFHPDEKRQNIQWESKFKRLSAEIDLFHSDNADEEILVSRITENLVRLHDVYSQSVTTIEAARESGQPIDPELIQVAWSRFIVQNQGMIFDASQLSQLLHREADRLQQINNLLVLFMVGAFLCIILVIYLFFARQVLASISDLSKGTEIIGSGNLDYLIPRRGTDEIGDLTDQFNRMTSNLKMVTTSIEELEYEITERKQVELALRESEKQFYDLFENMGSGVAIFKAIDDGNDFLFTAINKAGEQIDHTSRDELIGKRVTDAFPGVKDSRIFNTFQQVYRTGLPEFLPEVLYKDERIGSRWRENRVYKMPSGDIVAVYNDITSREEAEEELHILYEDLETRVEERTQELSVINRMLKEEIEQRTIAENANLKTLSLLDATIESTRDGILVIDTAGSVTKWNNQFIMMWNLPKSIVLQEKNLVLGSLISGVKNPEPFIYKIQEIHTSSSLEDTDIIELNDGRIFEWYSQPQRINDDIVGRVWSFSDVTARIRMEHQIEKSLAEKEILLKEIHHRVKNNMQVISSLLFMQARKTKDTQVQDILRDSQNRIKSIALVHEKIYLSPDLNRIDYNDYIQKITRHLFETYLVDPTHISLSISSETVYLPIDKAVPCSLIINELISNAVKYAFPEGRKGNIFIDFQRQGDTYVLVFRDDGVGIPEGTDFLHHETLGFELIRGLVRQLNGTIDLDKTKGTAYTITFPV